MLITKELFASRMRRTAALLVCLILAAIAILLGGGQGFVVAAGLVLLAVLFKIGAELSGGQQRLEAATSALRSLEPDIREAEIVLADLTNRLDEVVARVAQVEKSQRELDDQIDRLIDSLSPARRHRLFSGDEPPDLSLRSSTEAMLRRFREGGDGP